MDAANNPWVLTMTEDGAFLVCEAGDYEIPLEECRTSAHVLDWIMQVLGKNWANDSVVAGLAHAFDAVLRPQKMMCSFGKEKGPIDVDAQIKAYAASYSPFREVDLTAPVPPRVAVRKETAPGGA